MPTTPITAHWIPVYLVGIPSPWLKHAQRYAEEYATKHRQQTEAQCAGDPGECAFHKACMYACGRAEPPQAEAPGQAVQTIRLVAAIEGECEGLAVTLAQAERMLRYVATGNASAQAPAVPAPLPEQAEGKPAAPAEGANHEQP